MKVWTQIESGSCYPEKRRKFQSIKDARDYFAWVVDDIANYDESQAMNLSMWVFADRDGDYPEFIFEVGPKLGIKRVSV
jgi:hypothetical protein